MALFTGGLALSGELVDAAKVGVMAGSLLSALVGMGLIVGLQRRARSAPADSAEDREPR